MPGHRSRERIQPAVAGDDAAYAVRFTVHPLTYPELRPSQRLTVMAAEIGAVRRCPDRPGRGRIAAAGCADPGRSRIDLTLGFPPRLVRVTPATAAIPRLLTLCFHSASLVRLDAPAAADRRLPSPAPPGLVRAVIAGNYTGLQLPRIYQRLPALRDRLTMRGSIWGNRSSRQTTSGR